MSGSVDEHPTIVSTGALQVHGGKTSNKDRSRLSIGAMEKGIWEGDLSTEEEV